jgi:hypothetical protein
MPTRKLRLTKSEDQENRNYLSHLEEMGIPIGCALDPPHEPNRITLEQTQYEAARIYEMPWNQVLVVVPAKMTILKSGISITDVVMITPWEDCPLELCDPEESLIYGELIGGFRHPPAVLNPSLINDLPDRPLRPRQVEGVIIAHGFPSVPRECHEETLVRVELLLTDERRKELKFDFGVRLDRRLMRNWERRKREQAERAMRTERTGLFEPKRGQPGHQKSVAPEKPSSSSDLPVSLTQPVTQQTWNQPR